MLRRLSGCGIVRHTQRLSAGICFCPPGAFARTISGYRLDGHNWAQNHRTNCDVWGAYRNFAEVAPAIGRPLLTVRSWLSWAKGAQARVPVPLEPGESLAGCRRESLRRNGDVWGAHRKFPDVGLAFGSPLPACAEFAELGERRRGKSACATRTRRTSRCSDSECARLCAPNIARGAR